jgi:hypothetical protein
VPAAEINRAVFDQLRGMLRAPEVIVATSKAATISTGPLMLKVPFAIRDLRGRKEIVTPDGMPALVPPRGSAVHWSSRSAGRFGGECCSGWDLRDRG